MTVEDANLGPLFCHPGGKFKLANAIISMMPPHRVYLEPFLGGGSVFFRKPLAEVNVLSDTDGALIKGYRLNCAALARTYGRYRPEKLKSHAAKRALHEKLVEKFQSGTITPEEYFILKNITSYGCKVPEGGPRPTYGHKLKASGGKVKASKCPLYAAKLARAKVLRGDFRSVLGKYNQRDALAYLDPPYHIEARNVEDMYGSGSIMHPAEVCGPLRKFRGKFILSYNDHPEVRRACRGFYAKRVGTRYDFGCNRDRDPSCRGRHVTELLLTNYPVPGARKLR